MKTDGYSRHPNSKQTGGFVQVHLPLIIFCFLFNFYFNFYFILVIKKIYSLMRFLRVEPLQSYSWWSEHIEKPLLKGEQQAVDLLRVFLFCFVFSSFVPFLSLFSLSSPFYLFFLISHSLSFRHSSHPCCSAGRRRGRSPMLLICHQDKSRFFLLISMRYARSEGRKEREIKNFINVFI